MSDRGRSGALRVGVQLPEVERPIGWVEMRDIAQTIEAVGFDSIWVGDHLLFEHQDGVTRGPMEAWTVLAGLAEVTQRVQIGPLVAATSFHSPVMLAKKAATVDEMSGGRLILGLGAGWNRPEYDAFGFAYDNRVSRFAEAFTVIRRLLVGEVFDFDGDYYMLRGAEVTPRPRPGIPLMIGSNGPRMLRIAMPHVSMWNSWFVWFNNRAAGLDPLLAEVDAACAATGRNPDEVQRTAAVLVQLEGGTGRSAGSSSRPESAPITGSAESIAEELSAFHAAGITHLQLVLDPITPRGVEKAGAILAILR